MKLTRFFIYSSIMFVAYSCLTDPNHAPLSNGKVFDLDGFLQQQKKENWTTSSAVMINHGEEHIDTVVWSTFHFDSIANIIANFNYSAREQAGEFEIQEYGTKTVQCSRYESKKESPIQEMTVCWEQSKVKSIGGKKMKKSLLSSLKQTYRYETGKSFETHSTYVDHVQKDTLSTTHKLRIIY